MGSINKNILFCHCHTCNKSFHWLGITRHRAMHRDRNENCMITYTTGKTIKHIFNENDCK